MRPSSSSPASKLLDLATGIDAGDVKNGLKAAEKLRDKFSDAVGENAATVTAGFNKKTGDIAVGRSNSCGDCAEDAVKDALGGTRKISPYHSEAAADGPGAACVREMRSHYGRAAFPDEARFKSDKVESEP